MVTGGGNPVPASGQGAKGIFPRIPCTWSVEDKYSVLSVIIIMGSSLANHKNAIATLRRKDAAT